MTTNGTPSIYVASLSDYNAGRLHGCWIAIDADTTADDVWAQINHMLAQSRARDAEEHAIHETDNFAGWEPGEYTPIEDVVTMAHALQEHAADSDALAAWIDYQGDPSPETVADFDDAYAGCWDSEKAFVMDLLCETGWHSLTPEQIDEIAYCLDWDAIARDLFIDDYWSAHTTQGVHIFRVT